MRGFLAFVTIVLLIGGMFMLSLAFSHPGAHFWFFGGGLAVMTLAFLIPLQLSKD